MTDREEVVRRYLGGETRATLAAAFGMTVGGVQYHLARAGVSRRRPGSSPHHFVPTEHFIEVLDGLLLGGGEMLYHGRQRTPLLTLSRSTRYREWVRMVADDLSRAGLVTHVAPRGSSLRLRTLAYVELGPHHARWYDGGKVVPRDVRLTPAAVAYWFAGSGTRASNGYSVRFCTHGFAHADVEFLAAKLKTFYNWEPDVFRDGRYAVLRLSRSGDRLGLRRLVTGLMPSCFAHKLNLRASTPCSPEEAARRRHPAHLSPDAVAEARTRIAAGERFADIAAALRVNARAIGKLARGETHSDSGVCIVRRRSRVKRLTSDDVRRVLDLHAKGQSQRAIARLLGTHQPRVSRLLRRLSPPV